MNLRTLTDNDFQIQVEDQPRWQRTRIYGSLKGLSAVNKTMYFRYLGGKPQLEVAAIALLKLELVRKLNKHAQAIKPFLSVS